MIEKIQKRTFITPVFLEKAMKDSEDIHRLIQLKKYETPGDEYFQNFLEDFKDRQRSEMLRQSARGLLLERVSMWFDEINGTRWLVPAGATAVAAIALGVYAVRPTLSENRDVSSGVAALSASSFASPHADYSPADVGPAMDEQIITLQLPRRAPQVPALQNANQPGAQGLVPASARATYREL